MKEREATRGIIHALEMIPRINLGLLQAFPGLRNVSCVVCRYDLVFGILFAPLFCKRTCRLHKGYKMKAFSPNRGRLFSPQEVFLN